jgi:hypothetical protein
MTVGEAIDKTLFNIYGIERDARLIDEVAISAQSFLSDVCKTCDETKPSDDGIHALRALENTARRILPILEMLTCFTEKSLLAQWCYSV